MTTEGVYFVAKLSNDPKSGGVLAALSTTNGGKGGTLKALESDADITKLVSATVAPGIKLDAKNVTVKR